ncbi:hypothetical protein GGS20DRAFT_552561 [Poronia punctata]|nr:hypothetical protein GGS20DRAFT_552561 [Poronia punctata]
MAQSGVTVSQECINAFNELKARKCKFIIMKLSDNFREIVVEETSKDDDWENFRQKLSDAKSSAGLPDHRYAIYDFKISDAENRVREKILFMAWAPDDAKLKTKMVYATSKEALKRSLSITNDLHAASNADIEYSSVLAWLFPDIKKDDK